MDIVFKGRKLQKECNDHKSLVRHYGPKRAKLIRQRLDELSAAAVLEDMRFLPAPRCHELKGARSGQLSADLDGPYRLIFEPANNPLPKKLDGGLDWSQVNGIIILGVEDTHE